MLFTTDFHTAQAKLYTNANTQNICGMFAVLFFHLFCMFKSVNNFKNSDKAFVRLKYYI